MPESVLTEARILEAAVAVLRRHGPAKATVVDVAAHLGVSHGSIYRFFPSKQALRDAVVRQWLAAVTTGLEPLSRAGGPALEALGAWFRGLHSAKKAQLAADPELFEAFRVLTAEARDVLAAYKASLHAQVAGLLSRGMASGEILPGNPAAQAGALLSASLAWHHPAMAFRWSQADCAAEFEILWAVLARGLSVRQGGKETA
jgi:AcrR family transcriptional regulator